MNIVVMKFGGTSVANLSRIRSIAKIIKTRITSGEKKNFSCSFCNEW